MGYPINEYYLDIKNLFKTRNPFEIGLFVLLCFVDSLFDIYFNMSTLGAQDNSGKKEERNIFRSSRYLSLIFFLRGQNLKGLSVLDIGSGKGRALALLAHFGAGRVCGAEDCENLYEISIKNLGRYKNRFKTLVDIDILNEDFFKLEGLREYDIFYLFDPFPSSKLQEALELIRKAKENFSFKVFYHDNFLTKEKENILLTLGSVKKERVLSHDYFVVNILSKLSHTK